MPPKWSAVGTQSATTAGRANARAKVMFRFNVTNTASGFFSATAGITRFKAAPPPSLGSSCQVGTFVGQASQTFDSQAAGANGLRINNRLLPSFDFSLETGTGSIGYQDVIQAITSSGTASDPGCYGIQWF